MHRFGYKAIKTTQKLFCGFKLTKAKLTLLSVGVAFTLTHLFKHKRENFQVLEQPYRQLID